MFFKLTFWIKVNLLLKVVEKYVLSKARKIPENLKKNFQNLPQHLFIHCISLKNIGQNLKKVLIKYLA